jgi:hypothetical protein
MLEFRVYTSLESLLASWKKKSSMSTRLDFFPQWCTFGFLLKVPSLHVWTSFFSEIHYCVICITWRKQHELSDLSFSWWLFISMHVRLRRHGQVCYSASYSRLLDPFIACWLVIRSIISYLFVHRCQAAAHYYFWDTPPAKYVNPPRRRWRLSSPRLDACHRYRREQIWYMKNSSIFTLRI